MTIPEGPEPARGAPQEAVGEPVALQPDPQLLDQLKSVIAEADRKAKRRAVLKRRYGKWRYALGVPALLSGAAGTTALTGVPTWVTAAAAYAAFVLGGMTDLVKPDRRRRDNADLQADYRDLCRKAELALVAREGVTPDGVEQFLDRMHELDAKAGQVGGGGAEQ